LALYAQLIVESKELPEHLKLPYAEARKRIENQEQLEVVQWKIEDTFIDLLFSNPGSLRLQILQALVRTPRGLTAAQLHYALDSHGQKPQEWESNPHRLREIEKELEALTNAYLVKRRDSQPLRLGLQDEIYRIYAEHMAPQASHLAPHVARIWQHLGEEDRDRYRQNRSDEQEARQELYEQLKVWAAFQCQKYLEQKRKYLDRDERDLELRLIPGDSATFHFQDLSSDEAERRLQIQENILALETEEMVYALLLDPERNFNRFYTDLTDKKYIANDEYADFLIQTEMARVLYDPFVFKFIDLGQRAITRERGESPLSILHRAAQQEDVARWIKRFIILRQYDRAIEFVQAVEWAVERLQFEEPQDENIWHSWRHTLTRGERQCWSAYAKILANRSVPETLNSLSREIEKLIKLTQYTTDEVAIVRHNGFEEHGFAGDPEQGMESHPAEARLRSVISYACDVLGYGYISQGQIKAAVRAYGQALYCLRDTDAGSQRTTILNHLSRALSDLGRRSERMCLDGLELRRQLGAEVPLAYSYNTLALIYDDQDRPEDAWIQAAKAVAYFRRAGEPRGLGLALLQLGETLRHVAAQVRRGQTFVSTADSLYTTADKLLKEAREIFSTILDEPLRLTEIIIELGCLYRDWFPVAPPEGQVTLLPGELRYREALVYFEEGVKLASQYGLYRLQIDAEINKAWTHYYQGKFEKARDTLKEVEALIHPECLITPTSVPEALQRDDVWIFGQLSKIQALRGQIAMERFRDRVKEVSKICPGASDRERRERHTAVHRDEMAQKHLAQAAVAYSLGVDYTRLFSSNAATITLMKDNLYSYLRGFNCTELEDFHGYVIKWAKEYPSTAKTKAALQGAKIIDEFLHEFFGFPMESELHI
jgi:tetratricopeptide (TPR) repeat protein